MQLMTQLLLVCSLTLYLINSTKPTTTPQQQMKSTGRKYGKQASSLFLTSTGTRTPRYFNQPTVQMQFLINKAQAVGTIVEVL